MKKDNIIDTVLIDGVYVPIDESNKEHIKVKKIEIDKIVKQEKIAKIIYLQKRKKTQQQDTLLNFVDGFKDGICLLNKLTSLTRLIK